MTPTSRTILLGQGVGLSRERERRGVPDYYRPGPGYQPTGEGRAIGVSLDPDRTYLGARHRGYHEEEDPGRHYNSGHSRSVRHHDDDDWTLNDSVLNPQDNLKLNPTYWGGFRDMLATELVRLLQRRDEEFEQYEEYADDLEQDVCCLPRTRP